MEGGGRAKLGGGWKQPTVGLGKPGSSATLPFALGRQGGGGWKTGWWGMEAAKGGVTEPRVERESPR